MISLADKALPDNPDALKAMALSERSARHVAGAGTRYQALLIEELKHKIAKRQFERFGQSSERQTLLEQFELELFELEEDQAQAQTSEEVTNSQSLTVQPFDHRKPSRRPLPEDLWSWIARGIGWRRQAWPCIWGILYFLGASNALETKAWAQAQRSDNPAAPGQSYLMGDWGGTRSYLERQGVTFTFGYTSDLLANVSGGIKTGSAVIGAFQPQVDLDLQKLLGWEGDRIHIHGLVTHGPFFSATYIGNILAVSNLEAGEAARLYALWYEHNAPNDRWSVRVGLMLADSQFLQSDTASSFLNNGISWPTFLAGNLPFAGPAYPLSAPGIRVRLKPRDDVMLQAAVFSGDPSGGIGSNQPAPLPAGTVFSFSGGAFVIAEASYLPNQGKDASGLPGTYRIGAWYHTSSHFADQRFDINGISLANPQSNGIPLEHTGDYGFYGMIDQMIYRVRGTDDRGLSAFLRAGAVPNDRNLINFYADGGLLYKGIVPDRLDDKVGVAFAYASIGSNARGLDADIGLFGNFFYPVRSSEAMIEVMYQAKLRPWWTLQPELQYVFQPGGGILNPDGNLRPNALVFVVRSTLNF